MSIIAGNAVGYFQLMENRTSLFALVAVLPLPGRRWRNDRKHSGLQILDGGCFGLDAKRADFRRGIPAH